MSENTPSDDRSKLARAIELGSLGTSIAMEMVVPILIGIFIDRRLGTTPGFTILGQRLGPRRRALALDPPDPRDGRKDGLGA